MANVNAPHGFRPLLMNTEGGPCAVSLYAKPATDGAAISVFDFVKKVSGGVAPREGVGALVPAVMTYYQATPGTTPILGAALDYGAISTLSYHQIVDSILALFEAQCSGSTSIVTGTHIGRNANVSNATAASTTTHFSGEQVDSATIATTSTLDVRLKSILNTTSNAEGANTVVEVFIMRHANAGATAGV